jgi:hypothetical protein
MSASRRIVLTLSEELYGRLEARAAEGRVDAREWAERALLAALMRPESKAVRARRSREAGLALLSLLSSRPAAEGGDHAPHP